MFFWAERIADDFYNNSNISIFLIKKIKSKMVIIISENKIYEIALSVGYKNEIFS